MGNTFAARERRFGLLNRCNRLFGQFFVISRRECERMRKWFTRTSSNPRTAESFASGNTSSS